MIFIIKKIIDKESREEEAKSNSAADLSLLDLDAFANQICTDDEEDPELAELEKEKWNVRELQKIKRDKAEQERLRTE